MNEDVGGLEKRSFGFEDLLIKLGRQRQLTLLTAIYFKVFI
jgi:hypothetical protein